MPVSPLSFRPEDARGKHPLVLVFAPSEKSPAFENQISLLQEDTWIKDDGALLVRILEEGSCYAGEEKLDEAAAVSLRRQYGVDKDEFAVLLIGRDGEEKYRGDAPVQPSLILERLSNGAEKLR